jgi:hypothetical protein
MTSTHAVPRVLSEFAGIQVDSRSWPILVLSFPATPLPDAALAEALACVDGFLALGARFFQITDASLVREMPPAKQRKYAVDWMEKNDALFRAHSVGGANVAHSPLVRGIFTAVHWFKPPPVPTVVVATREEAMRYAEGALEAAGVPLQAPRDPRLR